MKIVLEWKEGEPADVAFIRVFSELIPHMTYSDARAVAAWLQSKISDPDTRFRYPHETRSIPGDPVQ